MSDQPNVTSVNSASRRAYFCHQCQREIEPLMAPTPTCPRCNSEFVEEIDEENDPRFADTSVDQETDEESEDTSAAPAGASPESEVAQIIQNLIAAMLPSVPIHVETTATISPAGGGTYTTTTTANSQQPNFLFTMGTQAQSGQDAPSNNLNLAQQMLQRFLGGGGNQNWTNLFNMVGDPRDYAWGPGGLDNIISQLMEQQAGRQAPPPASEEIINNLPKTEITKKQAVVEEQLSCPICKEDFTEGEEAICLPCKHTFHDDCIKPWLKMNGTCPVCRYSLVEQENGGNDPSRSGGGSGSLNGNFNGNGSNGTNGNFNIGSFNGNFNGNTSSSSPLPGAYPSSQQQNGQQNRYFFGYPLN